MRVSHTTCRVPWPGPAGKRRAGPRRAHVWATCALPATRGELLATRGELLATRGEHLATRGERSTVGRRSAVLSALALLLSLLPSSSAEAVQGLTAGRIPGLTGPDEDGFSRYTRPEGKSGGHGVGWSEIPRYTFQVPTGWDEKPVSIADLGGTEIDLRFENAEQGSLLVVVAPVLRFMDVGYNADVTIEEIGKPENIIAGFAPELYGKPLDADDVVETQVVQDGGLTYYQWRVKPHHLVSATAVGNRLFILSTTSNSRQWRRGADDLAKIQKSFRVPRR